MDDINGILAKLKQEILEEEQLDDVSVKKLKIGDIIYISLDREDGLILRGEYDTRKKYVVIIGFTPEGKAVGSLLVNSNIDPSKQSKELMDCQYPLSLRNYPKILEYSSWLDCSDIFEISNRKIIDRKGLLKGSLMEEDKERIMQLLRETDVFDNITKRRYGILPVK